MATREQTAMLMLSSVLLSLSSPLWSWIGVTCMDGRPLYVSKFKEKAATDKPDSTQHSDNKCTLFATNIQHHFGDQDLQELFKQSSAKEAVMKLDDYQLGVKRIKVAISNPPKRAGEGGGREDGEGFKKPSFIPPQARRDQPYVANEPDPFSRRSKTNISLVPRAVARKTGSPPDNQQVSGTESGSGNGESTKTKMSNDDFRKLLSKN